jgi:anti-sigma B factor antagonist
VSEAAESFACEVHSEGARVSVVLRGEIDAYSADRLRLGIQSVGDVGGRHVVVDVSRVGFVDSSGLSALVTALGRLREAGGVVTLSSPTRQLVKLFEITGVSRLFPVE